MAEEGGPDRPGEPEPSLQVPRNEPPPADHEEEDDENEEDDPVVLEVPVFLAKRLQNNLHLWQV